MLFVTDRAKLANGLTAVGLSTEAIRAFRPAQAEWSTWVAFLTGEGLVPADWAPDLAAFDEADAIIEVEGRTFGVIGTGEVVLVSPDGQDSPAFEPARRAGFRVADLNTNAEGNIAATIIAGPAGALPRPAGRVDSGTQTESVVLADMVAANALLVTVSIHAFGIRRRAGKQLTVTEDETGRAVDEKVLSIGKKLIDSGDYDAIVSLDGAFRREVERCALPSRFRRGTWLLPIRLLDWFEAELADYQAKRATLVDALCAAYARLIEEARVKLGPIFDARQYPDVDVVRACYRVDTQYESPGVPAALEAARPELFARESRKLRNAMEEAAQAARLALRQGLLNVVATVQDKLTVEEGKRKRLTEAAVENLASWLELFEDRNITNDVDLADLVERCQRLMDGVDRELLRDDTAVAAQVKAGFAEVTATLSVLVEDAPERRFDFSLDD